MANKKKGEKGPDSLSGMALKYLTLRLENPLWTHSECARQAGYKESSCRVRAHQLEQHPIVQKVLEKAENKVIENGIISRERIIEELAKLALSNAGDYFEWDSKKMCLVPKDGLTAAQMAAISEIAQTTTKDGGSLKMKLHDKKGALDSLARIFGMNKDALDVTSGGKPLAPAYAILAAMTIEERASLSED